MDKRIETQWLNSHSQSYSRNAKPFLVFPVKQQPDYTISELVDGN